MLTKEQLKILKKGDPIVINGTVNKINEDGHILATCGGSAVWIDNSYYVSFASEHGASVPTPKYDPTRLFRKGDKVRVVRSKGRSYSKYWEKRLGQILTVTWSEDEHTSPEVDEQTIDPSYLELVTPVEELEPYIIREYADFYAVEKDGVQYSIFFKGSYHANAKAAAEAERDRLNAEWRKEQEND